MVKQTQLAGRGLELIGGLIYVDDRSGEFGDPTFRLPSYTTVRVAANFEVSDSLDVRLEVNNLFDEEYYSKSYVDDWVQPGTPLNFRISANFSF